MHLKSAEQGHVRGHRCRERARLSSFEVLAQGRRLDDFAPAPFLTETGRAHAHSAAERPRGHLEQSSNVEGHEVPY